MADPELVSMPWYHSSPHCLTVSSCPSGWVTVKVAGDASSADAGPDVSSSAANAPPAPTPRRSPSLTAIERRPPPCVVPAPYISSPSLGRRGARATAPDPSQRTGPRVRASLPRRAACRPNAVTELPQIDEARPHCSHEHAGPAPSRSRRRRSGPDGLDGPLRRPGLARRRRHGARAHDPAHGREGRGEGGALGRHPGSSVPLGQGDPQGHLEVRAVRFHEYGGIEVLRVEEVDRPSPGP